MVLFDELAHVPLGHVGVADREARELDLLWVVDLLSISAPRVDRIDEPVVERAVVFELERAQ